MVVTGIGLAVLVGFTSVGVGSIGEFNKAKLVRERNPGNAMYDLQFFIATVRMAFIVSGAVGGALLALNGATWIALGTVARRLESGAPQRGGGAA
jgi:hypothetical protein